METKTNITIYLPDQEAQKFLLFQEYYGKFMTLLDSGVFTMKNGSVSIHFDAFGSISLIQRADILFNSRLSKKD